MPEELPNAETPETEQEAVSSPASDQRQAVVDASELDAHEETFSADSAECVCELRREG
jgi:hypothetical protein